MNNKTKLELTCIMEGITSMKEPSSFPEVLSKSEVASLLSAPSNVNHKAVL